MGYKIRGCNYNGEFSASIHDGSHGITHGMMSKEVFVDFITCNVGKLLYFDLIVDDDVEYVKADDDPCLMKPEVTD